MKREKIFLWCEMQYDVLPDYPWRDENAVLRHPNTGKWFGVVLTVKWDKLGLSGEGYVDVLNVKCEPMLIGSLRMLPGFLPAYHMNKDNWISILLDGTVSEEEIKTLLDMSYQMTMPKKKESKEDR